jgi:uncharacterized protein (TIGR04255 family)
MARIPAKLKKDPIAEATFDLRFTSGDLPEVVVGALAAHWKGFTAQRLPIADVPATIREQDQTFRYQPIIELRSSDHSRLVKIGNTCCPIMRFAPIRGGRP